MDWKSLTRKDPVEQRRRELEEQSRNLEKQRNQLEDLLASKHQAAQEKQNGSHPPVWRARPEESFTRQHRSEVSQRPTRVLQAQRHKDRNVFIVLVAALLIALFFLVRALLH